MEQAARIREFEKNEFISPQKSSIKGSIRSKSGKS